MSVTSVLTPAEVRTLVEWRKSQPVGWRDIGRQIRVVIKR